MTPSSVVEKIQLIFPQAQIKSQVTDTGFELQCTLVVGARSFCVRRMLDAHAFHVALTNLKHQSAFYQISQQPMSEIHPNIEHVSLDPPLVKWQVYQREILGTYPTFCEDILERYLNTDDASLIQQLKQLGLAPVQIAIDCSEEDLQIFRNLCNHLQKTKNPIDSKIFNTFQKNYPAVLSRLLEEMKQNMVKVDRPRSYQKILEILSKRVVGQDNACEILATTLVSQNNHDSNKVFLFVGPTGVGKTEMAKTVAFIKENRFVMLPMNQYQTSGSINNLFGSPIGFIGCGDKPHLVKALEKFSPIRKSPEGSTQVYEVKNVVILLDELEKAHEDVKKSMLFLFDEGYCSVQYALRGKNSDDENISAKYRFKNSIFIGTSNLYQQRIVQSFRNRKALQYITNEFIELNSTHPISTSFSPELLGRCKVIPFGPIPRGACYQAFIQSKIKQQIGSLKRELSCQDIRLENKPEILNILEETLYGEGIDLRRIKSFFDLNIKTVIYSKIHQDLDLSYAVLTISPYNDRLIGIKASLLFLGKLVDCTDLFPIKL